MYPLLKRILDIALGAALLTLSLPLQCIIAAAVMLGSGRPIFFSQTRAGRNGEPFAIWKFRTLHTRQHALNDPLSQTTHVGRVLRRWGLDELPQLWNVLIGDMSLIGPRPTIPEQVALYGAHERRRLCVRPGITGWAQIHGRNAISWKERIDLDVAYIEKAGFALDVLILLRTPLSLLSNAGVYGPNGTNDDFIQRDTERREQAEKPTACVSSVYNPNTKHQISGAVETRSIVSTNLEQTGA